MDKSWNCVFEFLWEPSYTSILEIREMIGHYTSIWGIRDMIGHYTSLLVIREMIGH